MSDPGFVTVESEGFKVTSNHETAEQLGANLNTPEEKPDLSEAASELGKASAAKRAAETQDGNETAETDAKPKEVQDEAGNEAATKPLGKPRDDPRARMLEATRKEAEAKREVARLAAELERYRQAAKPAEPPAEKPKVPTGKPRLNDILANEEDFNEGIEKYFDERLQAARQEWHQEQEVRTRAEAHVRGVDSLIQKHRTALLKAAAENPVFDERAGPILLSLPPPTPLLADPNQWGPGHIVSDEIIFSGEKGPALLLHFADHPDDLQRILALQSPDDVKIEMRLIARGLSAAPTAPAPVQVSKAKPPVRPVTGAPHTAESVPDDGSSYEDHKRYWDAKEKSARR